MLPATAIRCNAGFGASLLLPQERRVYLDGMQDGLAGLDAARDVLARAVKRMEGGR